MLRFEQQANGATSADIFERLKRGDRSAQEWVYRSYSRMVYTTARRMLGDPGLAEDATQDTFVDVLTKAGTLDQEGALGAWVRRIAINHCLMRLRSPWTRWRAVVRADVEPVHLDGATVERATDLERALDSLPAKTRAVIWLHDVEGYTHKEIGRLFGRTESYSKSQLARGYQRLRELRNK
ncbi:MAG: RNA polymerase sigma factor [Gammaproteobacteria bacterium]|nr:RNA polymerase sigma factor [Gammaproteobacteria bacterium]MDE0225439.1 RNA polymerase sigma factor [Gammaproteobacteria bacterium]